MALVVMSGLWMMGLTYPVGDEGEEHQRTVVLGPLAHYRAQDVDASTCSEDDHGSCPCCLFTRSMEAFDELLKARHFLAIRLFASRDADGLCEADCRVNGHDFAAALPLLREDQLAPAQARRQRGGFVAHEKHVAVIALGARIAGETGFTGAELQLAGSPG